MAKSRGFKKATRYTHQSAYQEYVKDVKAPLDYQTYDKAIRLVFKKLCRAIIVDKYEFKIPFRLGFIRIAKNSKGFFFWFWDRMNDFCRLKHRRQWSFTVARGTIHNGMGRKGLTRHYYDLKNNPRVPDYDVPRKINHRNTFRDL